MSIQPKASEKPRPSNVGILALEIYFPKSFVDQTALEIAHNIPKGKHTIGLGQKEMGFCYDNEDINSICLTVVARLMENYDLSYKDIGRLEVGTQTIVDKAKSVKSVLMTLFEESGNYNVEGIDTTHGCYGGTNALFNAVSWLESRSWDGRYALVVCGDIALYQRDLFFLDGVGSVAMLIGPNAPLVIESGLRASCMRNFHDFCKPNPSSEYPIMDNWYGLTNYFAVLDFCYNLYCKKVQKTIDNKSDTFSLKNIDYMLFHSSCCKLSKRLLDCLALNDAEKQKDDNCSDKQRDAFKSVDDFKYTSLSESIASGRVDDTFQDSCQDLYNDKTCPSLMLLQRVGGMHTATLYSCLASLLFSVPSENLIDKCIGLFSYGAGAASTMFSIFVPASNKSSPSLNNDLEKSFSLDRLVTGLSDLKSRLDSRTCVDPSEYAKARLRSEEVYEQANYKPMATTECLFPSTFYLASVDNFKRTYKRTPRDDTA